MPCSDHSPSRRDVVATVQTRSHWGVEIGGHRFGITRIREVQTIGDIPELPRKPAGRSLWAVTAGTFASVSAFGLLVFGAWATPRPLAASRQLVSVPVPAALPKANIRAASRSIGPGDMTAAADVVPVPSEPSDPTFTLEDEGHVAIAMRTGELQEWTGSDGVRRFLTAGSASPKGGRLCRDLALLVRFADGGSRVRTAQRCTREPVIDAPSEDRSGAATMAAEPELAPDTSAHR